MINLTFSKINNDMVNVFINGQMSLVSIHKKDKFYEVKSLSDMCTSTYFRSTKLVDCKNFIFERIRLLDDVECKELK